MQVGKIDEESLEPLFEKSHFSLNFKHFLYISAGIFLVVAGIYGFFILFPHRTAISNFSLALGREILDVSVEIAFSSKDYTVTVSSFEKEFMNCCHEYNLEILGIVEGYRHGYLVIR